MRSGPSIEDAGEVCDRLAREGIANTVCFWDVYANRPDFVSRAYIGIVASVVKNTSDCYLSVKAPSLNFDLELLKKVLAEASRLKAPVHFDSMAHDTVDRTFDLIDKAREIYSNLGCTLPGRWQRSIEDADRAIDMGLRVRVVKGEWPGSPGNETDPREGFLNTVYRLAGKAKLVAIATHNPTVARFSLRCLTNAGTPCELELLYGLPQRPLLQIAREFRVRARMYLPYGPQWPSFQA